MPFPQPELGMPFPGRELAGAIPWSRAGQFLFPEPELGNAVPWSRAGWSRSLRVLANSCSPSLCWPIAVPCRNILWSRASQFQFMIAR